MRDHGAQPLAVVMGLSPTGLHVVRTLARSGAKVVGVASGIQAGRGSRYLHATIEESDPRLRLERMCKIADAHAGRGRPTLIPTSDQDVDFVIAHHRQLSDYYHFQQSYADGLAARIMAKDSFHALCDEHGVAGPRMIRTTAARLTEAARELHFPLLVKPAEIHRVKHLMAGSKGWTARKPYELASIAQAIPAEAGTLVAQEIVSGPESEITLFCGYFDGNGELHQAFTARKLRQYPPGFGSASLVQSSAEPESAEIATGFLRALGYRGIAAAEFKRDTVSGLLRIIEINVRPSLWFSLSEAAARPVVLAAHRDLGGLALPAGAPQVHGIRWRYGLKDMLSRRSGGAGAHDLLPPPDIETVGPHTRRIDAVFDIRDPLPQLFDAFQAARKAVRRVAARVASRLSLGRGGKSG